VQIVDQGVDRIDNRIATWRALPCPVRLAITASRMVAQIVSAR